MDGSTSSRPLEELVREHAALRRVAVLVATEPSPAAATCIHATFPIRVLGSLNGS